MTDWETFTFRPFARYTHGYPDWSDPQNIEQQNPNYRDNTEGWRMIQGSSTIEGRLYGGCIEVLEFMKGTDFWPPVETFDEKLLFLETSEEKPTPLQVSWMLRNYGMQGVLDRINGILFGRCRDYTDEEEKDLEVVIRKILHEFGKDDLPVVMGMDFGHTDPQFILPLGTKVHINAERQEMKIQESPFS
jgi:muramoyltetrapeptide carboxypeptidase LdcA involved in peptidoglycan recycling